MSKTILNQPVLPNTIQIAKQEVAELGSQLPGFDLREIIVLLGGDYSQLCHILAMFQEDFSPIINELSGNLSKGELYDAEVLLHKTKGVVGNIGAIRLYDISEELDQQLKLAMFNDDFFVGSFEHPAWDKWQVIFADTMQTITDFLESRSADPHSQVDTLSVDVMPLLQELKALLIDNNYIDSDLLDNIRAVLGTSQARLYQEMLNRLMYYDYPEALRILLNIINSVREEAV